MMSKEKYQMALNTLFMMASEHLGFELNYEKNLLQELVDKATPKKVEEPYKIKGEGLPVSECPNCTSFIRGGNYCVHCGQAIDWSENE